jgi:hypothetical protein
VVEVSPPYDHADLTVNNAHRVVFEVLGGLAYKKRARQGGTAGPPGVELDATRFRYPDSGAPG